MQSADDGARASIHRLARELVAELLRARAVPPREAQDVDESVQVQIGEVAFRIQLRVTPCGPGRATLSPREEEIARMVAEGHTNRAIANVLGISTWTVSTHLRRVFTKLGVNSRAAMVAGVVGGHRWSANGPARSYAPPGPAAPAAPGHGRMLRSVVDDPATGLCLAVFEGGLDPDGAAAVRQAVDELLGSAPAGLVVDLRRVTGLARTQLTLLTAIQRAADAAWVPLAFVGSPELVETVSYQPVGADVHVCSAHSSAVEWLMRGRILRHTALTGEALGGADCSSRVDRRLDGPWDGAGAPAIRVTTVGVSGGHGGLGAVPAPSGAGAAPTGRLRPP